MKICKQCKEKKELIDFYTCPINRQTKDGYRGICKKCFSVYYINNKLEILKYRNENKELLSYTNKKYRENNKIKLAKQKNIWYIKNKQEILLRKQGYQKEYRRNNVNAKLAHNLRNRIWVVLKDRRKCASLYELTGSTKENLKTYLEGIFQPGMGWDNYGYYGWHIDHIKPCADFDLSDPEQQKQCFHYTNLQPLWAKDNLSKGKK